MIKLNKKYKYEYVACLPIELENRIMIEIKKAVAPLILTEKEKQESIENANNEKVCNLTDTINIKFI